MKYNATVYLTVVYNFEVEASSQDEAEILAMDIAECRAGDRASSVGVDSVLVHPVEGSDD